MAIFFARAKIISRSNGQNALACAAYRSGEKLFDKTEEKEHDYTRKSGILDQGIAIPEGAPEWMKDREKLWTAVEEQEKRKDSQLAREFIVAVPDGLGDKTKELTRELVKQLTDRGMVVDYALHEPNKEGDDRNQHWHLMTTMRPIEGNEFGAKARDWNKPEYLDQIKADMCQTFNRELQAKGMEPVDWRSYEAQGITDRTPQLHQGPTAANMERKGKQVDRKRHIDLPAEYEVNAQELGDALAKDPEYKHISTALYFASIDPKDWPEIAEKYKRTERMNNQLAFVEAVREWAPKRKDALVKERETQSDTIDEIKGQEPKQGRMAKIFQEDYEKYEKKHTEWAGKYNNIVETYNAHGDEIKRINEAMKEPTGQKLYEYGLGIKRAFEKAGKWLEERAVQILETAAKFSDFRAMRESFRVVEPSQREAIAALREQERQQKMTRGKDKDRGHGRGY